VNPSNAEGAVQWLFLDLNAFFASCELSGMPPAYSPPIRRHGGMTL
jgi:hypothetical protein